MLLKGKLYWIRFLILVLRLIKTNHSFSFFKFSMDGVGQPLTTVRAFPLLPLLLVVALVAAATEEMESVPMEHVVQQ